MNAADAVKTRRAGAARVSAADAQVAVLRGWCKGAKS
jgi:hypothetical protein